MHGVAEGIPGVTVDKYGSTLFVQSWRNPVVRARLLVIAITQQQEIIDVFADARATHVAWGVIVVWARRAKKLARVQSKN